MSATAAGASRRARFGRAARRAATPRYVAAIAALLALAALLFGPPGGDAAAHLYQTQVWREHGWQLWDNLWYGGRYSQVNYSLVYYPLSALFGTVFVVSASAGVAAGAFSRLMHMRWPHLAPVPSLAAALGLTFGVLAGTYPFLLGFAVALVALVCAATGRLWTAAALTLLTTLSHPLALVFLVIVLASFAVTTPGWWRPAAPRWFAAAVVAVMGLQALLMRAFDSEGATYPFDPKDAIAIAAFCIAGMLLARGLPDQRAIFALFAAYALLAGAAFVISSPMGGNVVRLLLLMGAPLLLIPIAARGFRPRAAVIACLAGALLWQGLPALAGWRTANTARAADESFWLPAIAFLEQHSDPGHRVEVVATADNWEAYYLARRGVPLARGWFRQDDFPTNRPLYNRLTARTYQGWMRRTGIRYVLLPDDPLDYTARNEADLLRSGRSGLSLVADLGAWTVYELPDATPIVTPKRSARVLRLTSSRLLIDVDRPGTYRVRVRYTPYWRITGGGPGACAAPLAPWGTQLRVRRAGVVRLDFDPGIRSVVKSVLGDEGGCALTPAKRAPLTIVKPLS
ncbi:MAG: hypothetical protein U0237_00800 [Thermoleophilia bacterium]